jgi:hypothetical protein
MGPSGFMCPIKSHPEGPFERFQANFQPDELGHQLTFFRLFATFHVDPVQSTRGWLGESSLW